MKTLNALATAAVLFAAASVASAGAVAADAEKTSPAEAPAAKAKPHSHMQEKTGITPAAKKSKEAADEKSATEGKKIPRARHYHPRDGK